MLWIQVDFINQANSRFISKQSVGFQTLITLIFETFWVSNLIGRLSEGRESLLVNFSSLRHETTKLRQQRIMVKISKVS